MTERDRDEDLRRVRVRISGRVQGVVFRASTRDQAEALGLAGWVRNLPDGAVEAAFQGDREIVDRMIEWCRKGPRFARVTDVDVREETPRPDEPARFEIRY